jgi:hypothetical protein
MQMLNDTYQDILTNDERATAVAKEILDVGHIELQNFLSPEAWEQLSETAKKLRENAQTGFSGGQSAGKGDDLKGTFGYEFGHSDEIMQFCERVHQARQKLEGKEPTTLDPAKHLIGFPYKDARGGATTVPTPYHFDGAYINILIPIMLPEDQEKSGGSLTVFPNIRKKYGVALSKVICRGLRHSAFLRKVFGQQTVLYTEGSGHIFFGDISFHGVEPITNGERLVMTINSHW